MIWKDLKEFANMLDEKQLKAKVILWHEDSVTDNVSAFMLNEDHYAEIDGDPECYPESQAKELIEDNPENYPNGMGHFKKAYDKGHPLLMENF